MEMRREAERYCSLVERAESFEPEALAAALEASLADLIAAASRIPDVPPSDDEVPEGPSHDEWAGRFAALQRALGDWSGYWTTLETHGDDAPQTVTLPLGDDLADVWRDLKTGLLALESGWPPGDVQWQWRFDFYVHWGRHATEALRALHARLADSGGPARPTG